MTGNGLVLVHGLFVDHDAEPSADLEQVRVRRASAVAEHGASSGIRRYEWIDGGRKPLANRMLRTMRGTARAVDAAEIVELDDERLRAALAAPASRICLENLAGCAPYGLDPARSFVVVGTPRLLLDGPRNGQRILWFGVGAERLGESAFIQHYTEHHGPLFAGHAPLVGLRRYSQVPDEQRELGDALRELGLGHAPPPSVFAELYTGRPSLDPRSLRAQRAALKEIRDDERRHIDFERSMLLLAETGRPTKESTP